MPPPSGIYGAGPTSTRVGTYNKFMSQQPDVLVIGGGIIGLTTAFFLAKEGASVEVVERGDFGAEASWAGAGIIPPGKFSVSLSPIEQLRAFSAERFPDFSAELQRLSGIDNGYRICGGIEFFTDESPPLLLWDREAVPVVSLDAKELAKLAPKCNYPGGSIYHFASMAQVRNPRHVRALILACQSLGIRLHGNCDIEEILVQGTDFRGVRLRSGEIRTANRYLISAGAWSGSFMGQLGFPQKIHPVRGQIVLLKSPEPVLRQILLHGKRYLVPREDGYLLIGSSEEPETGFTKGNTNAVVSDLLDFAYALVPALCHAHVEKYWSGLRPCSPDGFPYLGAIPGFKNAFIAAGHFRAGIQLSPGTGIAMAELIVGKEPTLPLDCFRLDREPILAGEQAFRS